MKIIGNITDKYFRRGLYFDISFIDFFCDMFRVYLNYNILMKQFYQYILYRFTGLQGTVFKSSNAMNDINLEYFLVFREKTIKSK